MKSRYDFPKPIRNRHLKKVAPEPDAYLPILRELACPDRHVYSIRGSSTDDGVQCRKRADPGLFRRGIP